MITYTSCAQWNGERIKGNGDNTTVTRKTSDYNGVHCAGFMNFKLVKGTEGTITMRGESNLLEYIITEVKEGELHVKVKDKVNLKPSNNSTIEITIPFDDIESVSLAGSGDLWNEDVVSSTNLRVSLAGSGDLELNINSEDVKTSVAGSGDMTVKGTTDNLKVSIAGSGDFHGYDLTSVNVEADIAGSGGAKVTCNGDLKARIAGSGDIRYKGNPKTEDTKVMGSGSIMSN